MTISECIARLEEVKEKVGDVELGIVILGLEQHINILLERNTKYVRVE